MGAASKSNPAAHGKLVRNLLEAQMEMEDASGEKKDASKGQL